MHVPIDSLSSLHHASPAHRVSHGIPSVGSSVHVRVVASQRSYGEQSSGDAHGAPTSPSATQWDVASHRTPNPAHRA